MVKAMERQPGDIGFISGQTIMTHEAAKEKRTRLQCSRKVQSLKLRALSAKQQLLIFLQTHK